jgi:hypothetical protein
MKRLAVLLSLLLPACSTSSDPVSLVLRDEPPPMQPLYTTQYSNINESRRLLIRDAETWSALWAEMISSGDPRTPPYVDFTREDVLVAAMGERRAAGYGIVIGEVVPEGNAMRAVVTSTRPAPSCESAEIMTAPLDAIRIRKLDGPLVFDERGAVRSCSD